MKKGFLYILSFVFIVCLSSGMYAAEEFDEDSQERLKEQSEQKLGHQIFFYPNIGIIVDSTGEEVLWKSKKVEGIFCRKILGGEVADVQYKGNDRIREIISLKDGRSLWKGKAWLINFKSNQMKVKIQYGWYKWAIVDLENGEVDFDEESYEK